MFLVCFFFQWIKQISLIFTFLVFPTLTFSHPDSSHCFLHMLNSLTPVFFLHFFIISLILFSSLCFFLPNESTPINSFYFYSIILFQKTQHCISVPFVCTFNLVSLTEYDYSQLSAEETIQVYFV